MRVEGNRTESEIIKERGRPVGYESSHGGNGEVAEVCIPAGMLMAGFEAGRTIELRKFEFCRIRLWVKLYVPDGVSKDKVEEAAEGFVLGMLQREEASVVGDGADVGVPDVDFDVLHQCVCRSIGVMYGLTLKSGSNEWESHLVDVIEEMPVSDGNDMVAVFEKLSDDMAGKLDNHHKRIKEL